MILAERGGDPIVGEITHGPFANPMLKKIIAEFGRDAFARSSACMEFESFLRQIKAGGKRCLEIGTFYGVSAIVLSQFFDEVVCVTVDVDGAREMKYRLVKYLDIRNMRFFDVANNEEKRLLVEDLEFDFCYSDGDHANDTVEDFAMVRRCGRVLFHEYWPLQPPVWNLVNSLPQHEVTRASVDCFAYWEAKRGG